MKINIRHIKDKDLFEVQVIEQHLKTHFLVNRKILNDIRVLIEKALVNTAPKHGKS